MTLMKQCKRRWEREWPNQPHRWNGYSCHNCEIDEDVDSKIASTDTLALDIRNNEI